MDLRSATQEHFESLFERARALVRQRTGQDDRQLVLDVVEEALFMADRSRAPGRWEPAFLFHCVRWALASLIRRKQRQGMILLFSELERDGDGEDGPAFEAISPESAPFSLDEARIVREEGAREADDDPRFHHAAFLFATGRLDPVLIERLEEPRRTEYRRRVDEIRAAVRDGLEVLGQAFPDQMDAVRQYYLDGRSLKDIAAARGVGAATVRQWKTRGWIRLCGWIERACGASPMLSDPSELGEANRGFHAAGYEAAGRHLARPAETPDGGGVP